MKEREIVLYHNLWYNYNIGHLLIGAIVSSYRFTFLSQSWNLRLDERDVIAALDDSNSPAADTLVDTVCAKTGIQMINLAQIRQYMKRINDYLPYR